MLYLIVRIPKDSRVLLLEDSPMRQAWFQKRLSNLTIVESVQQFKDYFAGHPICDYIFFDHDLGDGNGNGVEAVQFIKDTFGGNNNAGFIHSWNRMGAARMQSILPRLPYIPFGEFEVEEEK